MLQHVPITQQSLLKLRLGNMQPRVLKIPIRRHKQKNKVLWVPPPTTAKLSVMPNISKLTHFIEYVIFW